jgi:hypothetical protein
VNPILPAASWDSKLGGMRQQQRRKRAWAKWRKLISNKPRADRAWRRFAGSGGCVLPIFSSLALTSLSDHARFSGASINVITATSLPWRQRQALTVLGVGGEDRPVDMGLILSLQENLAREIVYC